MDRVRFGRALGTGTREAARALLKAADAATAPNPNPPQPRPVQPRPVQPSPVQPRPAQQVAQQIHQARVTTTNIKRGGKRFGEALWGPFAKLSGVVMLEVTGVLFSLFALTAALDIWKHHADFHTAAPGRQHLLFATVMFVVFGYFTASSFVRASRRSHKD